MCVYVCLAKSGKTGRLVLAETLSGSGAAVDAEERRKKGFASCLPDVPAAETGPRRPRQVRPPGGRRGGEPSLQESARMDFSSGFSSSAPV